MFDKFKDIFSKATKSIKKKLNGISQPIKFVIIGYFLIVVALILSYYAAWVFLFTNNKASLNDLLVLINAMIGTSMIAFITFIAGCFVDLDGNGIPDQFEKEGIQK
ncbi:MAG: hypothetical protein MJ187_04920 [Alphaproteobacteria bacterium]|nr:hypothetical protein [Alphaproteobacteria bacterium]MCQ2599680.1 hypothetical protein [Alphaproteobacteria bacterium]